MSFESKRIWEVKKVIPTACLLRMRSASFGRLGMVIPPNVNGKIQRADETRSLTGVGAGITNLRRLTTHQDDVLNPELATGLLKPRLRIGIVHRHAVDDDFHGKFPLQARTEQPRLHARDKLRRALRSPSLIVNFGNVDGVHEVTDLFHLFERGTQGFRFPHGGRHDLKKDHRDSRTQ